MSILTSTLASLTRGGRGIFASAAAIRPRQHLELYEFESCPHCRLVREVLTEIDLDAMVYPCPKGGSRFRPWVIEAGGKAQFPYLVDPNTGRQLYEAADIIAYLFETYARQAVPLAWRLHSLNAASSMLASRCLDGAGTRARPGRTPDRPLELYSFESSPFARRVRETLCELELPYLLRNVGRTRWRESIPPAVRDRLGLKVSVESEHRKALVARSGRMMVPYLVDPNTETELFETKMIREYLERTYADQLS